jgi:cyclophilin family peptidyl-prolyl cis-trans isomerase
LRLFRSPILGGTLALVLLLGACSEETPTPTATVFTPTDCNIGGNVAKQYDQPPAMSIDTGKHYVATLDTNKGTIVIDLFADETPKTVNNFVFLAREGFYDGVCFHRIIKNFMIQGGDPEGTGTGGPGYRFEDEPVTRDYVPGTLAMANAGPNTNGSQFFIMHGNANLPKQYTIFGLVSQGLDVVNTIAETPVVSSGEGSTPLEEVVINSITIEELN